MASLPRSQTLVIDADGIVFAAASAVEKGIAWDDDIYTTHADLNEAIASFISQIEAIRKAAGNEPLVVLCFSCPTRRYFRHRILPTYKGQRGALPSPRPLLRRPLQAWAEEHYRSYTRPELEADDVVGIIATNDTLVHGPKIIVSNDKDLRQVPGNHLNPSKLSEGVYAVDHNDAYKQLWMQVLTGDTVDNYPGCPGIGPVRAEKILAEAEEPWIAARAAFHKAGLTDEDFLTQVNVARILTTPSYNFSERKPKLWQIP